MKLVRIDPQFEAWREKARQLIAAQVHFDEIEWITDPSGFVFGEEWNDTGLKKEFNVPPAFVQTAKIVSTYRDSSTWALLYRCLYRLVFENNTLLEDPLDPDTMELQRRAKLVSKDLHKMKAFVRFREVVNDGNPVYMAWHSPDHRIIRLAAPFFKERFNGMKWVIMTSDETAHWDGTELTFSSGVSQDAAPKDDDKEDLWKVYYQSIFNPARIKIRAMKKELPVRHWKTLPEAELISHLIKDAPDRLTKFYESQKASNSNARDNFNSLNELNQSLKNCQTCGICPQSNGPVQGLGKPNATLMIVGEQPGDEEDQAKVPFIGPAGKVLNQALHHAGLNREDLYLTNAVKGFKFIPKEHQRWHKGANLSEIKACSGWLKQEVALIKPRLIVCLGRSAAFSVLGKMVKISEVQNKLFQGSNQSQIVVLPHPASILRSQEKQEENMEKFLDSWKRIKGIHGGSTP